MSLSVVCSHLPWRTQCWCVTVSTSPAWNLLLICLYATTFLEPAVNVFACNHLPGGEHLCFVTINILYLEPAVCMQQPYQPCTQPHFQPVVNVFVCNQPSSSATNEGPAPLWGPGDALAVKSKYLYGSIGGHWGNVKKCTPLEQTEDCVLSLMPSTNWRLCTQSDAMNCWRNVKKCTPPTN